jgi:BirA family transcriptional regulator, biotin operon repressor / biotin---[acetyl-CoA-carboxylase] ligase
MLADRAAAEGEWLVALFQDAGKGRQGREWRSAEGNFFGSTLAQLRESDPPAPSLALAAGLALVEAADIAAPGRRLLLKWPNDLLLEGGKLGGILLERSGDRVVAGFGVNLAKAPQIAGRATADLAGAIAPQAFAPLLAASFARLLAAWRSAEPEAFARAWLARAHPMGSAITVRAGKDETLSGTFAGIDPDGALRLDVGGTTHVIRAGDIFLD